MCTLLSCLPPPASAPLRASLLALLPALCRHQHGHRVAKRLWRQGAPRERAAVGRHVLATLHTLAAHPHGKLLVSSLVLSRAAGQGGQGQVVLERLVRWGLPTAVHWGGAGAGAGKGEYNPQRSEKIRSAQIGYHCFYGIPKA